MRSVQAAAHLWSTASPKAAMGRPVSGGCPSIEMPSGGLSADAIELLHRPEQARELVTRGAADRELRKVKRSLAGSRPAASTGRQRAGPSFQRR